jgi:signal transduction histidine kinase
MALPPPSPADGPHPAVADLRDAERMIVRLRWLAMASWLPILLRIDPPVPAVRVWAAYAVTVLYVATTHFLNRQGHAIRATALATTILDPAATALICGVTRGLDSDLYPFFYLTTLATSIRFGMRETLATVVLNSGLSTLLFLTAPGSTATFGDLALRVFFLFFVALEGGLLSRAARRHSQRRQEVLRRLIHVEEEERRRLAGEIHDRLGRRFFSFYQALDRRRADLAATDERTAGVLANLSDEARGCADEIRNLSNALRPVVLDDFGFVEALREHVAAIGDLDVTLHIGAPSPVRPEVGIVLFRVLEEAIANVRRHADARRVEIDLVGGNGSLELRVRDDGRGFDPDALLRGHFGLLYMRERVEGCGGRLRVSSHPGSGTEVRATVPAGSEDR